MSPPIHPRLRGYAMRIKSAIANHDRNAIESLDDQLAWSAFATNLEHMTSWLVAKHLITKRERTAALQLLPVINNPSLRIS